MKCLSIFVGIVTVLIGIFAYKCYLPISPKLAEDSIVPIVIHNAISLFSYVGEKLGIGSSLTNRRFLMEAFDWPLSFLLRLDELVVVQDTTISGVSARIYRPKNIPDYDQVRPGFIYFHGGGLVTMSAKSNMFNGICSKFANATSSVVISVDYRLAPEHLFPAQFQDCYSVVSTIIKEPTKFGIIEGKIVLGGDSAGGLLATAVSLELIKKNRGNHIAAQLLVYPWLQAIDVTCLRSYRDYSQGFLSSKEELAYCLSLAITGKEDLTQEYVSGNISRYFMHTPYWKFLQIRNSSDCKISSTKTSKNLPPPVIQTLVDSRLSPLLAETVEGFPPTFIVTAEYDILASEGKLFADRLKKAGISVLHKIYSSYHGFLGNAVLSYKSSTVATEAMQDQIYYLNSVFYDK